MDIGSELRAARLTTGLSQSELAARAGTSQAAVSAYESGAKSPSATTLVRLLAAAGARLAVETGRRPLVHPSEAEHERVARTLADVLALAAQLPVRHESRSSFPRLPAP